MASQSLRLGEKGFQQLAALLTPGPAQTFPMPGNELKPHIELGQKIAHAIRDLISEVPVSHEIVSLTPKVRAEALAEAAAWKAAAVAASLAIVPGPLGMLTIIPALGQIWRIQRQLVADIAACYGQSVSLTPTVMVYCLFRHGSATVFKETVVQIGGRMLVREASLRVFQKIIEKVSINVTQRVIGQFISRWLPAMGSVAIGAYTFRDTKKVSASAIDAFEKEIEAEFVVLPADGNDGITEGRNSPQEAATRSGLDSDPDRRRASAPSSPNSFVNAIARAAQWVLRLLGLIGKSGPK